MDALGQPHGGRHALLVVNAGSRHGSDHTETAEVSGGYRAVVSAPSLLLAVTARKRAKTRGTATIHHLRQILWFLRPWTRIPSRARRNHEQAK